LFEFWLFGVYNPSMRQIVLIAHNVRSSHNVGSLLRTAEGLGLRHVYMTGYTPYPAIDNDSRLPHLARKITGQINKTALGSEQLVKWSHAESIEDLINDLKDEKYFVYALEQAEESISLLKFLPPKKVAILVGNEVRGLGDDILKLCGGILEIPMLGEKESFNVAQAAAMALYHCRYR
jgi:tRNA G18 (ribose-2'-O)-methylase SpoU